MHDRPCWGRMGVVVDGARVAVVDASGACLVIHRSFLLATICWRGSGSVGCDVGCFWCYSTFTVRESCLLALCI